LTALLAGVFNKATGLTKYNRLFSNYFKFSYSICFKIFNLKK
jgi:hypothetical protein